MPVSGNSSRRGLGLGLRGRPAAAGEGETSESDIASERIRDETQPTEENSSFPVAFQDLKVRRRDPPNLFLYAAGENLLSGSLTQTLFAIFRGESIEGNLAQ